MPKSDRWTWLLLIPFAFTAFAFRNFDFLKVQIAAFSAMLLVVWLARRRLNWDARPPRWCAHARRWSRNAWLCCALPAVVSVALRLLLLPWIPVPHPVVPDEYSYLFLAKTFLLGRLTNPTHPLWQHFETIHIFWQPTYSSMYMAGQACFLALGKLLTGSFFGGVVLSTALFCAALVWFLRAMVPPGWALFGGLLAAVRFGAASYWNDSYWGGSVAALGGSLALGGAVRLTRGWKMGPALAFAGGAVILANTRPYEGFGLVAALSIALVWQAFKGRASLPWKRIACAAAASAVIFGVAGWAMTRQWKAVTGDALTLPYVLNLRTYGWPLTLPWTPVRPIAFRNHELAVYRQWEIDMQKTVTDPDQVPFGLFLKGSYSWLFFFGPFLCATLLFTGRILRTPRLRWIWRTGTVVLAQVLTTQCGSPHYLAPAVPVVLLFIIRGLQHLSHWRSPVGPAIVRFALPLMLLVVGIRATGFSNHPPPVEDTLYMSWCCTDKQNQDREPLVEKLTAESGRHLVLVRYDIDKYQTFDWVYNEPDIDSSKIVFAHDMGPEKNRELLDYYPDRRVWRVRIVGANAYLLTGGESTEPGAIGKRVLTKLGDPAGCGSGSASGAARVSERSGCGGKEGNPTR